MQHKERLFKIFGWDIDTYSRHIDVYSALDFLIGALKKRKIKRVYSLLPSEVIRVLEMAGFKNTDKNPEIVVVGFDTELTYEKLKTACLLIQNGIPWFLAHPDIRCPWGRYFIPDSGSIGNLIEQVTGVKPIEIGGKPNPKMLDYMGLKYNTKREEIFFFGDRLTTDFEMAKLAGIGACVILTGETHFDSFLEYMRSNKVTYDNEFYFCENWYFLYRFIEVHTKQANY